MTRTDARPDPRAVLLFVALLLALALLGGASQQLYRQQHRLMAAKASLQVEVSVLREAAARVNGPQAIRRWAHAQGMVPAPENEHVVVTAPLPAPQPARPAPGVEVLTLWR